MLRHRPALLSHHNGNEATFEPRLRKMNKAGI